MNTPDNCYLDKGHDAHDLLGPGESCKACGFVAPANTTMSALYSAADRHHAELARDLAAAPATAEPTQQDSDDAVNAVGEILSWAQGEYLRSDEVDGALERVEQAIARARHAGEVAGIEKAARQCDEMEKKAHSTWSGEYGNGLCTAYKAAAAAIRSLAPTKEA